jgi:hypothetical protein
MFLHLKERGLVGSFIPIEKNENPERKQNDIL